MRKIEYYVCPAAEVTVPGERVRKEFNKRKLNNLALSIQRFGQKQPGVCRLEDGKPTLVAGERRLRACRIVECDFSYVLEEEADPSILLEIELEENLNRENLTFQEEAIGKQRLHELKQKQHGWGRGGWGVKQTSEYLQESVGNVQEDIELAEFIKAFPEVANAKNKTEAKKVVKRMKEDLYREEALEEAKEKATASARESLDSSPSGSGAAKEERSAVEERILFYSKFIRTGRMEEQLLESKVPFQVVLFDPPWGVSLDEVAKITGERKHYNDSAEYVFENLPNWLGLLWNRMDANSHLYMFFGIVYHRRIYDLLHEVGFITNEIPIIWYKQGSHRTRNPDIWPGRSYEPIAFARKGKKDLVRKGAPDVAITQTLPLSVRKSHPSPKHPDIFIDLLKRSAYPGDKVLDPMCGSGMSAVAIETLRHTHQLEWLLIDEDQDYTNLALANVTKGYGKVITEAKMVEGKEPPPQVEVPDLPEDYRDIEPGTKLWARYWKEFPEKQDEMLKWKIEHLERKEKKE